ncbi:MAG: hypothetical protein ACI9UK_000142 [Candidatus Krumholzibacteriia bacterium]|jgi:hypothetical protein
MRLRLITLQVFGLLLLLTVPVQAQYTTADTLKAVAPGLVYREYSRIMQTSNNDYRVTDPNATYVGDPANSPSTYLPNPVLSLMIGDLQGAIKAVAVMDCWGGHVGTADKQIRFNNNIWVDIPSVAGTPTDPSCYTHQYITEVEIPLSSLVEGANIFEGLSGGQNCYNFGWGQWGWYGLVLRVIYDPAQKTPPTGVITSPISGSDMSESVNFTADASSASGITKIDFIGYFDDFDVDGDGVFLDWQRTYQVRRSDSQMTLRGHLGTATNAPYGITWDLSYVPDQAPGGVSVVARIKGGDGLWYVTDRVDGLSLDRPGINVLMYKSTNTPENYWVSSGQTKSNQFVIPAGDNLANAESARLHVATWNGVSGQAESGEGFWTRLNGWTTPVYGEDHRFSFDRIEVPLNNVQNGNNTVEFYSESSHHGVEILWPGPGMLVRYVDYAVLPATVLTDPKDTVVIEGATAQFSMTAVGGVSISYQWQRNDVDIPGATNPVYTTPALTILDSGDLYQCVVANSNGGETSAAAQLTVVVPGDRVSDGQIVLYGFDEENGNTVADLSGVGAPADLTIDDLGAVTWLPGALAIDAATVVATAGAATKLISAVKISDEITIEAWLKPNNLTQNGPARIVTLSSDLSTRNFTLGQGESGGANDVYNVRLRSTTTDLNGTPDLSSPAGSLTTQLSHVVFTRESSGLTKIYKDGVEQISGDTPGGVSIWDDSYRFGVGNEMTGDRPWLGELHLVAVYDRALPVVEVVQNYAAGPVQYSQINVTVSSVQNISEPVAVLAMPDGSGDVLSSVQHLAVGGAAPLLADATILVTLTNGFGDPIADYPAEKISVRSQFGGWAQCAGSPLVADGPTNSLGQTTISGALHAGGSSAPGELFQVDIIDPLLNTTTYANGLAGLEYFVHSPDLGMDLDVNLTDVAGFASIFLGSGYDFSVDYRWDGEINLSDLIILSQGFGTLCPGVPSAVASKSNRGTEGTLGVVFDAAGTIRNRKAGLGEQVDVYVTLDGSPSEYAVDGFDVNIRVSDNIIIHKQEIIGDGLNLRDGGEFIAAFFPPQTARVDRRLHLAKLRVSVTDNSPAYFWIEPSQGSSSGLPSLAVDGSIVLVNPISGDVASPVASLNDDDFALENVVVQPVRLSMSVAPNPFNPLTEIHFRLPVSGHVNLQVFDTRGRLVATLQNETMSAGDHRVTWRGADEQGRSVAAGVYLSRLQTGSGTLLKKMILVK